MSLAGLLNQTITLYSKSSYNEEGREVVGSGSSIKARVQITTKRKLLPNGSIVLIDAIAYVLADTTVSTDDKVSYDSVNYKVYGKYAAVGENGSVDHYKLELTKWQAT